MSLAMSRMLLAFATLAFGGCAAFDPTRLGAPQHPVARVMTEHSMALACLGRLIDRSGKPALSVQVENVPDTTVPRNFEDRRLSHGGQWLLHTAIHRLGTDKVVSVKTDAARSSLGGHHIVLDGAWTQDDISTARRDAELGGVLGISRLLSFGLQSRQQSDVIAGDFISSRNGRVLHASAISVVLGSSESGFRLLVEDGDRSLGIDLSRRASEGPQFAQRRIAEAAVLVHVSRAMGVDYAPCIEQAWAGTGSDRNAAAAYAAMNVAARHRAVQAALVRAGHSRAAPDGVWGPRSANALARFQAAHALPATGRHTAAVYLALLGKPNNAAPLLPVLAGTPD